MTALFNRKIPFLIISLTITSMSLPFALAQSAPEAAMSQSDSQNSSDVGKKNTGAGPAQANIRTMASQWAAGSKNFGPPGDNSWGAGKSAYANGAAAWAGANISFGSSTQAGGIWRIEQGLPNANATTGPGIGIANTVPTAGNASSGSAMRVPRTGLTMGTGSAGTAQVNAVAPQTTDPSATGGLKPSSYASTPTFATSSFATPTSAIRPSANRTAKRPTRRPLFLERSVSGFGLASLITHQDGGFGRPESNTFSKRSKSGTLLSSRWTSATSHIARRRAFGDRGLTTRSAGAGLSRGLGSTELGPRTNELENGVQKRGLAAGSEQQRHLNSVHSESNRGGRLRKPLGSTGGTSEN